MDTELEGLRRGNRKVMNEGGKTEAPDLGDAYGGVQGFSGWDISPSS